MVNVAPFSGTDAGAATLVLRGHDGARLVADSWGDERAPAVLLLHGFGQARHTWRETGASLAAAGYRAVAPDARGHGDSGWAPDGRYALDDFVADARAIAAGLDGPAVVGASMGGLAGMLAEAESPGAACRALVLVDIAPRWRERGVARILAFMRAHPEGFASLDEASRAVTEYLPHRQARRAAEGLRRYLRADDRGRLVWHWDPRLLDQVGPEAAPYHDRLMAAARALACPTLLVTGELSDVVGDEAAAEFLEAAPHARHVSVPGAAHMVAGDANEAFTDSVLAFLQRTMPAPDPGTHGPTGPRGPGDGMAGG